VPIQGIQQCSISAITSEVCRSLPVESRRASSTQRKVGAGGNEKAYYFRVAAYNGQHDRRQPVFRAMVQVGAAIGQQAHNLNVPVARRIHQRRLTMLVARVDIGASRQQGINRRQIRGFNGQSPFAGHLLKRSMISLDPGPPSAYRLDIARRSLVVFVIFCEGDRTWPVVVRRCSRLRSSFLPASCC
jgi:hypothetical protein